MTAGLQVRGQPRPGPMLLACAGWASCFLLIRWGLRDAPPLWFAGLRALTAGALLLVAGVARRSRTAAGCRTPSAPIPWKLVGAMAVTNVALGLGAMALAAGRTSTGAASVLANAQPLLVVVPAWLLYGERPWRWTLPALGAGMVGLALTAVPSGSAAGSLLALMAAAGLATTTLLTRRLGNADVLGVAGWQYLGGGLVLVLLAAVVEGAPGVHWTSRLVIVLGFLAVFGTAVPVLLWLVEARRAALTPLAAWTLMVPVLGVLLGVVVAAERPTGPAIAGYAVVLAATAAVLVGESRNHRPGRTGPGPDARQRAPDGAAPASHFGESVPLSVPPADARPGRP